MSEKSDIDVMVRHGTADDLKAINALYNWYIENTPITFDLDPIGMDLRRTWFEQFGPSGPHQLLVAETDGKLVGYAASLMFRKKAAYSTSVETTIYVDQAKHRGGVGQALYEALFQRLRDEDLHRAYAGITLPNAASEALHRSFGFEPIGIYQEVGRKFDRYWDVSWYQKALR